jgi:hypothetical protein
MIDPKNSVNLTCGIVVDPEVVNENILKLRVAVDYAGSEKGSSNTSGYFDIVYYLNNDENSRNAKFIRDQIAAGNLKKGSQIQLTGRLVQERWTANEKKGQRTVVVAEAITYAAGSNRQSTDGGATGNVGSASAGSAEVPDVF